MQTTAMIASTAPFGLTVFLAQSSTPGATSYLEYGAFGLCAILVGWMCKYISDLRADEKERQKQLLEIAQANTRAFERWAALLGERPCLVGDTKTIQG